MTDEKTAAEPTTGPLKRKAIASALLRYRVLAWITGVWLLLLVAEMVAKYGFDVDGFGWVGVAHGWIYFIYLIFTVDLSIKARWPWLKLLTTAIAGTIPFLSFYFEHKRTHDVKTAYDL
ncbi:DUF3817 domain-containing protein [Gordonia zhaorongruii]|uniref:DUF3817 domain-containing protein n=1 Tax=Gordonia zhaorongruii TaxID=2597659 RepID=UPI00104FFED0|nr:DUF3817 domain-containing protein [Gordonia zhaorongruii]